MMLVNGDDEPGRKVSGPPWGSRADAAARRVNGPMATEQTRNLGGFTWSIAEILRGDFKQSEYGKVVLPFVVLRRLDCSWSRQRRRCWRRRALPEGIDDETRDFLLFEAAGGEMRVYNTSRFTFATLKGSRRPSSTTTCRLHHGFSANVRDIFLDKFRFTES